MCSFRVPKYNTVFDEDKGMLYSFDPYEIRVLRFGGKYPIACKKTEENPNWMNYIPVHDFPFLFNIPLFKNTRELGKEKKYIEKKVNIYERLVEYLDPENVFLVKKFRRRQWLILCLLMNAGDFAKTFVRLNPALTFLLSAHAVFHPLQSKKYWRSIRSLILKPRKEILSYFGFPCRNAVVHLFDKINHSNISLELFFWLRKELQNRPALIREFSFLSKLNAGVLSLMLSGYSKYVKFELINSINSCDKEFNQPLTFFRIRDIIRMKDALKDFGVDESMPIFSRRFQVEAYHDYLVEKLNDSEVIIKKEYPKSNLDNVYCSCFTVEKIEDNHALHKEGEFMGHCIFSYHKEILKGNCHVARVLEPQRLTVLYKEFMNTYKLVEVEGKYNSDARGEIVEMIRDWLNGTTDFGDDLEKRRQLEEKYQTKLFEDYIEELSQ